MEKRLAQLEKRVAKLEGGKKATPARKTSSTPKKPD
jgi:hypothetical protein